ncbi:MAG: hypothetical protein ACI8RP_000344 [Urechidicola sp.]|jgi:hypothetical protein
MSLTKILPILLIVGLFSSCQKETDSISSALPIDNSSIVTSADTRASSVELGLAGQYAILSKTGVTDVYPSVIGGDVGASPITGAAILLTCPEVTGAIHSVNAAGPSCIITTPSRLTTAVANMETAYTDAAGRVNPDFAELGAGNIGGLTLTPGLYNWSSAVLIPADVTISGSSTDIWIFQIAQTLDVSSAVRVTLEGGAQAKNIFWQVASTVTLGTTSHMEGVVLGKTGINMLTGSTSNGRMLAQTAVVLQKATVIEPAN